ncbi:MAG TPA: TetR/AcrR family transcriptional regulator [Edaphobacter sp.]|nr:TetR/AcrR family transcriptional regulator [Edaphobacter sp.]HMF64040.1 TetR/AcrR family transcriptional regulator [Edaphobacter sp.]
MPSVSSNAVRREPQQERSTRRLASFLQAAEDLFVEVGFEATTMTAIAERTGASIGTLYHYFPDKASIASALVSQYALQIEAHWRPLMEQARTLTHQRFAELFIQCIIDFVNEHPAYLSLQSAPTRFHRDPAARKALRVAVAGAFRAKNPSLSSEKALLAANVALQIVKGLTALYPNAGPKEKPLIVAEFKRVLALYLGTVLA